MSQAYLEHANISVSNPDLSAQRLCDLFDWKVRWSGPSMDEGYTVHVGGENSYVAFFSSFCAFSCDGFSSIGVGVSSCDSAAVGACGFSTTDISAVLTFGCSSLYSITKVLILIGSREYLPSLSAGLWTNTYLLSSSPIITLSQKTSECIIDLGKFNFK